MSAMGRGQAGEVGREVVEVIRQVMREFDALGRSVRGAAGGMGGAAFRFATDNFVTNAGARAGRNFAIDATAGILGDFAKFGFNESGGFTGSSVTSNFLRAASKLPIVGDIAGQVQNPLEQAGNRVAAITTAIRRAGGEVTPETRQNLWNAFHPEEQRAENERLEVEKLQNRMAGTGNLEGTRYAETLDAFVDLKNAAKDVADWFRNIVGPRR